MRGDGVLIVGYGNPLRGDDGAGWHAAERLAADPRCAGARVLTRHQLTPELAEEASRAAMVVLVDAAATPGTAGTVTVHTVEPAVAAVAAVAAPAWSHHLDPAALVALAERLYGTVPPVYLVTVGAGSLGVGERLSPAAQRALPAAVDTVARLVAGLVAGRVAERVAERGHA